MKFHRLFTIFFALCLVSSVFAKIPVSHAVTVYSKPVLVLGMADGYETHYTNCYPYLDELNLKPFIYPMSDLNGSTFESQDLMNWTSIDELMDYGCDLVSHSATHPHLATDNLSEAELIAETGTAQETFDNETGTKPYIFAVPFGDRNATVNAIIDDYYAITLDDYFNCPQDSMIFQYNATDIDYQFIPCTGLGGNNPNGNLSTAIKAELTEWLDWLVGNGTSYAMILGWHTVFTNVTSCRGAPYGDIDLATWEDCMDIIYDYWKVGENITIKEINTLFSSVILPLRITDFTNEMVALVCSFMVIAVLSGMIVKIQKIKV